MQEAGLPETLEEAVERVQISKSSSEGYAFLGNFNISVCKCSLDTGYFEQAMRRILNIMS